MNKFLSYYSIVSLDSKVTTTNRMSKIISSFHPVARSMNTEKKEKKEKKTRCSTPLHQAVRDGDVQEVERLVQEGADINARDEEDYCPLHYAVLGKNKEIIKILIDNGASISALPKQWISPFHLSLSPQRMDVMSFLLEEGADVNEEDCHGNTPLHVTASICKLYDSEMLKILLKHGADVTVKNIRGETPLHVATTEGIFESVEILMEHGADPNARDNVDRTPKFYANSRTDPRIKMIVNPYPAMSSYNLDPSFLFKAVKDEDVQEVRRLVKEGVKVNCDDGSCFTPTPLHCAAKNGNATIVKILLEADAHVAGNTIGNFATRSPLYYAISHKRVEATEVLLKNNALKYEDPYEQCDLLLFNLGDKDLSITGLLLKHGVSPNFADENQNTPLHYAVGKNKMNLVKLLLYYGAQPLKMNNHLTSAYHLSQVKGYYHITKYMDSWMSPRNRFYTKFDSFIQLQEKAFDRPFFQLQTDAF